MKTQSDIHFELNVPASPELAYDAISKVREWWNRDTPGEAFALGDSFTVNMSNNAFAKFEVTEAERGRRYVWHVADCFLPWFKDKTEWTKTDVIFDIVPTAGGSLIEMTHRGLTPNVECYDACNAGWEGHIMSSLRKLITEGVGTPNEKKPVPKVILGNHTAVFAARSEQDKIRMFYRDVLGFTTRVLTDKVDRFQLDDLHFCFVYDGTSLHESDFLKSTYLELKTDNVDEMRRKIVAFGVKQLDVPDPHLYFQAPGGQVFRLVGIGEDLSIYEGSPSPRPGSSASLS